MKHFYTAVLAILLATMPLQAQELGSDCSNPYVWNPGFEQALSAAGSYWMTLQSDSLPMILTFEGDTPQAAPHASIDLKCNGEYPEDIRDLIALSEMLGVSLNLPMNFTFSVVPENPNAYTLKVKNSDMQEMLSVLNLSVELVVNIETYGAGVLTGSVYKPVVVPPVEEEDTTIVAPVPCEDRALLLVNDMDIVVEENDSVVVHMPIPQWNADLVYFMWESEQPTVMWVNDRCEFPTSEEDETLLDYGELEANSLDKESCWSYSVSDLVDWYGSDLYARFTDYDGKPVPGVLHVVFGGLTGPMAEARELHYDESVDLPANGEAQVLYFRKSWHEDALMLEATAPDVMLHFGSTPDFAIDGEGYIAAMPMLNDAAGAYLSLSKYQQEELGELCAGGLIFVRVASPNALSLTPRKVWTGKKQICLSNSLEIFPTDQLELNDIALSKAFRLDYDQWSKQDVWFSWTSIGALHIYVDGNCSFGVSEPSALLYEGVLPLKDESGLPTVKSYCLTRDVMAEWAGQVDAEGYLFLKFSTAGKGTLTCSLSAPSEPGITTATEALTVSPEAHHLVLRNGVLYIERDGRLYDLLGRDWGLKIED